MPILNMADHAGAHYRDVLSRLHQELRPQAYLEVGTLDGGTLQLAKAPSIAVDPFFQVKTNVIGSKELCFFMQITSDDFFAKYHPGRMLGSDPDFMFLDGMHLCEYLLRDFINAERVAGENAVIALHDCLPVEIPMTDRKQCGTPAITPHRDGWWTGDVWRTALYLKRRRPDLRIVSLDAPPTGLILISQLKGASAPAIDVEEAASEMMAMDLESMGLDRFFSEMEVESTQTTATEGALATRLLSTC